MARTTKATPQEVIDMVIYLREERGMWPRQIGELMGITRRKVSNIYSRYGNFPPKEHIRAKGLERKFDFTQDNLELHHV